MVRVTDVSAENYGSENDAVAADITGSHANGSHVRLCCSLSVADTEAAAIIHFDVGTTEELITR